MKRPKIIINCAMSADGKISLPNRRQMKISSESDMKRVHHLRNTCDGVLVGIKSVLTDNPKLTVKDRYVESLRQPVRIVLDTFCNTPVDALVVNRNARTIICCKEEPENKIFPDNVELLFCKIDRNDYLNLDDVLRKLYHKNIQSLLVEGGGTVIWNFLLNRFVDDLYVYIGPLIIGGKQTPTMADGEGIINAEDAISLSILDILQLDQGLLIHYQLKKN